MQKRTLGNTELEVSILSYGASPLGGVFGDVNEKEGIATVHHALGLGINLIDCSLSLNDEIVEFSNRL